MRRFHISDRYYPVFIEPKDLVGGYWMQTAVNGAKLNLQEAVEFQQQTLFDVVMQATNREILLVLEVADSHGILYSRLNEFASTFNWNSRSAVIVARFSRKRCCRRAEFASRNELGSFIRWLELVSTSLKVCRTFPYWSTRIREVSSCRWKKSRNKLV